MIQPQQVQNGRLQIVDVDSVLGRVIANLIGLAHGHTAFDSAPGQPHGVSVNVVVAAQHVARFALRGPAKLAPPDHESVFQQAPLFEIADQSRTGAIDLLAALFQ